MFHSLTLLCVLIFPLTPGSCDFAINNNQNVTSLLSHEVSCLRHQNVSMESRRVIKLTGSV